MAATAAPYGFVPVNRMSGYEGGSFRQLKMTNSYATSMFGETDNRNVSMRYREGWEPCLAEDHPELMIMSDAETEFENNIVIGGLMLCKCSEELMQRRNEYYNGKSKDQQASVDQNYMRENDPRMPLLETERHSETTFGVGRGRK